MKLGVAVLAVSLSGLGVASADECTFAVAKGFPVDDYADMVTQYRNGTYQTAGGRLQTLDSKRVDEILDYLRQQGWAEPCLLAASMLHTEVGMRVEVEALPEEARRHFEIAWKLTGLVRAEAARKRFQRDWLLLMGLFYQKLMFDPDTVRRARTETLSLGSELFRSAQTYFDDAVAAFPRDPEILLAAGTLFEWSGALRFGDPRHLAKAESLYRRARALDPSEPIVQLRHGMTLWKQGEPDGASDALERVLELTRDEKLVFRARIALGRIASLSGDYDDAIALFRAARESKPGWQVGSIALSHALHVAGSRDESTRVLEEALDVRASDADLFGWWSYETGLIARFAPLMERLRGEVFAW